MISQTPRCCNKNLLPFLYSLGIGGALLSILYYIFNIVREYALKYLVSTITVENNEQIYKWIETYLAEQQITKASLSNLRAVLQRSDYIRVWNDEDNEEDNTDKYISEIKYLMNGTLHMFTYKGVMIFVEKTQGQTYTVGYENRMQTKESITFWCWKNNRIELLKEIIQNSYIYAQKRDSGKTSIYAINKWESCWDKVQTKEPRKLDSVILDENLSQKIIKDISYFLENKQWYQDRGIPYKRGYLLYGPPGTGKTSFIQAIAGQMKLNICTMNLSNKELDDEKLISLLEVTPRRSLVLLEDIDAIFVDRNSRVLDNTNRITFSGLLNALDGVRSQEGRILFMTTNFKEKLDQALLRPGRADVHLKLDYASQHQISQFFLKFYQNEEKLAAQFCQKVSKIQLSMAILQGHFVKYKNDPKLAIEKTNELSTIDSIDINMDIYEWLLKFGLEEHAPEFINEKLYRVSDLQDIEEDNLQQFGINSMGDQKNILGVLNHDKHYTIKFQFMSKNSVQKLALDYFTVKEDQEFLSELVPENQISEFQLRKILDSTLNFEEVEEKIREFQKKLALYQKTKAAKKNSKSNKTKFEYILNIPRLFQELKMEKYLKSVIKHNLVKNVDIFLSLEDSDLQEQLKIKNFVDRAILLKKITELKKDKEKKENIFKSGLDLSFFTFDFEENSEIFSSEIDEFVEVWLQKNNTQNGITNKNESNNSESDSQNDDKESQSEDE